MLKLPITYTNFNDQEVTRTFYFNLTEPEIIELRYSVTGGLEEAIERITEQQDEKKLIDEFKRVILLAYGEKSEDGERFIKSPELSEHFAQSAAYAKLFMQLATDSNYAANFLKGLAPKGMAAEMDKTIKAITTPVETVSSPAPLSPPPLPTA